MDAPLFAESSLATIASTLPCLPDATPHVETEKLLLPRHVMMATILTQEDVETTALGLFQDGLVQPEARPQQVFALRAAATAL